MKKIIILVGILSLFLVQTVSGEMVSLIDNTDRCIYDKKLDLDKCYSVYRVCDSPLNDIELSTFKFSNDNITYSDTLEYISSTNIKVSEKDLCYLINISANKNPFQNVDNVLCTKERCYYEYAWWNASYHIKWAINGSTTSGTGDFTNYMVINDSFGVFLGDGTQYIWCNYTNHDTRTIIGYLYAMDNSTYACVNASENERVEMHIDQGNGTDYNFYPEDDLLMWWHGNESIDSALYGIGLTAQGCTREPNGKVGSAFDCDRASNDHMEYADTTHTTSIDDNEAYSWCIWIYAYDWNTGVQSDYLVGCEEATYPMMVRRSTNDAVISWLIDTTGADEIVQTTYLPGSEAWFHLCGTLGGTEQNIYINGVMNANNVYNAGDMASWNNVVIGCRNAGDRCFNGMVEEFMLWNRTLNDTEIMGIYNNTVGGDYFAPLSNPEFNDSEQEPEENITPSNYTLNLTTTCDICRDLPIKYRNCSGNILITIRERIGCVAGHCQVFNQTDQLFCSNGCSENLTIYGADCNPTEFDINIWGWSAIILILIVIFSFAELFRRKKGRRRR